MATVQVRYIVRGFGHPCISVVTAPFLDTVFDPAHFVSMYYAGHLLHRFAVAAVVVGNLVHTLHTHPEAVVCIAL